MPYVSLLEDESVNRPPTPHEAQYGRLIVLTVEFVGIQHIDEPWLHLISHIEVALPGLDLALLRDGLTGESIPHMDHSLVLLHHLLQILRGAAPRQPATTDHVGGRLGIDLIG